MRRIITAKKGQNLIEIVLIAPLLLVLLFGILEYALFQRNINVVQDIALDAAVVASRHFVDSDITPDDPLTENPAVEAALNRVLERIGALGQKDIVFEYNNPGDEFGQRPFALYEFKSINTVEYDGEQQPTMIFFVDYRDPINKGVSTQLVYHYSLVLFGISIPLPGGRQITIIPRNVPISSTQTKQYIYF